MLSDYFFSEDGDTPDEKYFAIPSLFAFLPRSWLVFFRGFLDEGSSEPLFVDFDPELGLGPLPSWASSWAKWKSSCSIFNNAIASAGEWLSSERSDLGGNEIRLEQREHTNEDPSLALMSSEVT